ncbi:MAG: dienelactone hydrolase family protein [Proteobacteria bacterium]|nr:dienelactone hydrolase family protein [Pseudomonadota bacterium]
MIFKYRMRRIQVETCLIASIIFLVFSGFGCASSKKDLNAVTQEALEPGPCPVESQTLTLVDDSRTTNSNGSFPGAPDRTLVTEVWYPAPENAACQPAFPLIIHAHGFFGTRSQSDFLTRHLASHGYVVVSPDFPLTNMSTPGGPSMYDVLNQPGDVSFLIDTFINFSKTPGNSFSGMIDEEAVGVSGHSLGGLTSVLVSSSPAYRDSRVKAALPLAPFDCFLNENSFTDAGIPVLFMGGNTDLISEFESNLARPFELADHPKYLVEIAGGTHMGFISMDMDEKVGFGVLSSAINSGSTGQGMLNMMNTLGNADNCVGLDNLLQGVPFPYEEENISPSRQREITKIYAAAFFGIYLKTEDKWEEILSEDFDQANPDLEFSKE